MSVVTCVKPVTEHHAVVGPDRDVCVFDQALCAYYVEITLKHPYKFQNAIITRIGVFHTICTLLSAVCNNRRHIAGVMDGRIYNRTARLHKRVHEAFKGMAWKCFRSWLKATHADDVVHG